MEKDHPSSAKESEKSKNRIVKKWGDFTRIQREWIASYEKRAFLILMGIILGILLLWVFPKYHVWSLRASLDPCDINEIQPIERIQLAKDIAAAENSARLTIAQIIGGVVVLLGLYATFRNIEIARENHRVALENLRVTEEGKLTERFSKAIELLGSEKLDVKLGGIYALERIARDSQKDHWTVMEVLTAFVREQSRKEYGKYIPNPESNSAIPTEKDFKLREDIQAALTVIGRRKWFKQEPLRLNLSNSFLGRASLFDANLRNAYLSNTSLWEANLFDAKLNNATLFNSNLIGTNLQNANLTDAEIAYTNLVRADFRNANLTGADLSTSTEIPFWYISGAIIDENTQLSPELEKRYKAEQANKAAAQNE